MPLFRWLTRVQLIAVFGFTAFCCSDHAYAQSVSSDANSGSAGPSSAGFSSFPNQFNGLDDALEIDTRPPEPGAEGLGSTRYGGEGSGAFHRITDYFAGHIALDLGAGFNAPIGNDIPYITWGGNFTIGGGVHLNKRSTILAEYQFMGDKLPGGLIAQAGTQGGHAHIWSLTLDPVIDLLPGRTNSIYMTGGGGFYRKVTSFTDPGQYQNEVVSHFSSNQGGVSFGLGVTHRLRWQEDMRFFAEARYSFVKTPSITETNGLGTTELLPVTVGFRW
jgi:hypothetical protein